MAEPTTINVALIIPGTGDLPGTWGSAGVNPDFIAIDGFLGGVQTVSAAGAAPITLSSPAGFTPTPSPGPTQSQNGVIRFSGALTGNVQITLPLPGFAIIENLTTGAFVLSFRAIGTGQVIAIQQGSCRHVYNDGTNVRFVNLPDVGTYLDIAASSVPAWISACTIPPYLNCDGSTFSAATYPYLNAFLGGNTLPDLRGVARYTLNQGTNRVTAPVSGLDGNTIFSLKATQTNVILTANLPAYSPAGVIVNGAITISGNANSGSNSTGGGGFTCGNNNPASISASQSQSNFIGTPQGGTSSPFGVIGSGNVAGITLIGLLNMASSFPCDILVYGSLLDSFEKRPHSGNACREKIGYLRKCFAFLSHLVCLFWVYLGIWVEQAEWFGAHSYAVVCIPLRSCPLKVIDMVVGSIAVDVVANLVIGRRAVECFQNQPVDPSVIDSATIFKRNLPISENISLLQNSGSISNVPQVTDLKRPRKVPKRNGLPYFFSHMMLHTLMVGV